MKNSIVHLLSTYLAFSISWANHALFTACFLLTAHLFQKLFTENTEEQSEDDVLIEDDDVTSGILEDGETFENVKNGDEIASDVEDENNLEDNEDDGVFEKDEEELATSGSESSESIPDETGINKRKINEDTRNETKRIKLNEPSPAEETITEREDSIEIQTNDLEVSCVMERFVIRYCCVVENMKCEIFIKK